MTEAPDKLHPLVSIVIPVYNREKYIKETLDCAINQTYQNIEIIVCDNKSLDNTWEIIQEYAQNDTRVKTRQNDENVGPVLNWKKCFDMATGQYIKILWSDDLMATTFIEKTLPLFDNDTAFVITSTDVFDEDKVVLRYKFPATDVFPTEKYLKDMLVYKKYNMPVSPGCALFRKKDIDTAYMADIPNGENLDYKRFGAGNDLMFFLITASKYPNIKIVNTAESFFRHHKSSITVSNDLDLYYEWSKFYFINTYKKELLSKYKAYLSLKLLNTSKFKKLYNNVTGKPHFLFIFELIIKSAIKFLNPG